MDVYSGSTSQTSYVEKTFTFLSYFRNNSKNIASCALINIHITLPKKIVQILTIRLTSFRAISFYLAELAILKLLWTICAKNERFHMC